MKRRGGEAQERPAYKHTQTEEGRSFHRTTEDGTSCHVLDSILSPWLHMDLMSEGQRSKLCCLDCVCSMQCGHECGESPLVIARQCLPTTKKSEALIDE